MSALNDALFTFSATYHVARNVGVLRLSKNEGRRYGTVGGVVSGHLDFPDSVRLGDAA